jgi:hypothetical protein
LILSDFTPEVFRFIRDHETEDPYKLILSMKEFHGIPVKVIAEQIAAHQKIRSKVPHWYSYRELIYPSAKAVEMASSEITAIHKRDLIDGERMADLTGGLGVDSWAFSQKFNYIEYNDLDLNSVECAQHNYNHLQCRNVTFSNKTAQEFLKNIFTVPDIIYLDPLRREMNNTRKWKLSDSSPDINKIMPELLKPGCQIMVKLSPWADLKYIMKNVNYCQKVHIVSVNNECKELLIIINKLFNGIPQIITTDYSQGNKKIFEGNFETEAHIKAEFDNPQRYIYEPNSAIQKSGLFRQLGNRYDMASLHVNSHLYTSDRLNTEFPGRIFKVEEIYSLYDFFRKKPIKNANVITRNFPMEVMEIREKASIKEGDLQYVIATTNVANKSIFIIAERIHLSV